MYKAAYGGRGSGKSHFWAIYCIIRALQKKIRVACLRTIDNKNDESALALIKQYLESMGLEHLVKISASTRKIKFFNGSEIMFFGANDSNHKNFKSTEGIDICWLDEASLFTEEAIRTVVPTIRKKGAEILFSWNPDKDNDPCSIFIEEQENNNGKLIKIKANYYDNPFISEELIQQAETDKKSDYERYLHIWEGHTAKISDQLIYSSIITEQEFESPDIYSVDYNIGIDWGHVNYSAAIRSFIKDNILYVDYESYVKKLNPRSIKQFLNKIPYSDRISIIGDCNNPLMIEETKSAGYFIKPCEKNTNEIKGVTDGIYVLRSLDAIIIHPRCQMLLSEMKKYRWQKSKGVILPKPIKEDDHGVDALRYGNEKFIKWKLSENFNFNFLDGF